jgi:single-strand DNA-binding protein
VSRSLNKAILIGNVGSDPEIRTVGTGGKVANFSLATSRTWNDQSGTKQEKTEWHRCVVWNAGKTGSGLADVVERYVKKGEKILRRRRNRVSSVAGQGQPDALPTEIRVRELMLLGGRAGGDDMGGGASRSAAPSRSKVAGAAAGAKGDDFTDFPGALEDEDDDLPF